MTENELSKIIVEAAIAVHRALGPGLLESVYETVLAHELENRDVAVIRQVAIPITYNNIRFEEGFRADIIVSGKVILELKSVEEISNLHKKQLNTYLRLTGMKLGLVLNFGAAYMKDGIARIVNGLENS